MILQDPEPKVCGLEDRPPDANDDAFLLSVGLGLQSPCALTQQQQTAVFQWGINLLFTAERCPEFGESLRAIVGNMLWEGGDR